jgi:hypothetical protein
MTCGRQSLSVTLPLGISITLLSSCQLLLKMADKIFFGKGFNGRQVYFEDTQSTWTLGQKILEERFKVMRCDVLMKLPLWPGQFMSAKMLKCL